MQLVQGVLDDGALDSADQVIGGEVGVDHVEVAVLGQVDGRFGVAVHQALDASGPVAGGEGELVGVLVAQGVEQFKDGVEGAAPGEFGQVIMDDFRRNQHSRLLPFLETPLVLNM